MTATAAPQARTRGRASSRRLSRATLEEGWFAVLPALLVIYLGFDAGGFFPDSVGFVALVLTVMLVLRLCAAGDSLAGAGRGLVIVGGLLAGFAAWVLLSGAWSPSTIRPLVEFDRAWMYLLVLVTLGLTPRSRFSASWTVRSLAFGAFVVSASALTTRLLPDLWPTDPGRIAARLSYPLTYWNALGVVAATGTLLAVGLTASDREPPAVRVVAAGSIPVFATTLYFTFSRGAIAICAIGLIVYLVVSLQRALVGALVSVTAPVAFAVVAAYRADALAAFDPTTPAAVSEGERLVVTLGFCVVAAAALRFLASPIDRRMRAVRLSTRTRRTIAGAAAATVVAALAVALALGAAGWTERQFDRFGGNSGEAVSSNATDARGRLADPSNNGRTDHWDVALEAFSEERLKGHGAGTYEFEWDERRPQPIQVLDAHSLYLETLAELGLVGLLLLAGALLGILGALWRGMRGPNRGSYAALFAAGVAWVVHAGVDWDWEMPAATIFLFAAGGMALAGRRRAEPSGATTGAMPLRLVLAVGLLVAAVMPALMMVSQGHLSRAAAAFERRDCAAARDSALSSIRTISQRAEAHQILGYCNIESRAGGPAVEAMERAVALEPESWEYRHSLALARAANGQDPRPAVNAAARRAPLEPLMQQARRALAPASSAREWQAAAGPLIEETIRSGRLTLR